MASYLIDLVLMVALVVTALRSGRMYNELKSLRESERGLAAALEQSEASLNKAAEAVIALKYEGVSTLRALEAERLKAAEAGVRLADLVQRADFHAGKAVSAGTSTAFSRKN
ncbi:hypothetical protein FP2506_18139 [Fulvimarina pelagi HTCC2506]|uniref:Uncharacterized protein n=1 Tax=Fulvimarina pelagi HTCC2506 TaxID=314231 RepID=Q0G105_9HYPH|nr:hypothetical protein [Fulvimarina pelagi]EAU40834.1 hypothetical protein FP2506_18139 [Fulvimarina pelagi HTCC2506]